MSKGSTSKPGVSRQGVGKGRQGSRGRVPSKRASALAKGGQLLGGSLLAAAAGWNLYSRLAVDHEVTLPEAIAARRETFKSKNAGGLSYYLDQQAEGTPLVLIHSINAAASAREVQPLFDAYRTSRPVFALELPGYGFSERAARPYSPNLFSAAIRDFLEAQVGEPADLIALSLGGEFAARVALEDPDRVLSLTLISPTGLGDKDQRRASQRVSGTHTGDLLYNALSAPLWARAFFDLIASRRSIRYFLAQSFNGPTPLDLIDYAYASSHQPGAEHAPLYFLSGKLFTPEVRRDVYEKLTVPTLALYDQDPYVSFETLPDLLQRRPNWQALRIAPTRGLPHFERLADTRAALERFWEGVHPSRGAQAPCPVGEVSPSQGRT